jgi:hypothetical protein
MRRLFNISWLLLLLGIAVSYPSLPEQIGDPGKEASREAYAALMVFMALNALLASHHFVLWVGQRAPDLINLPHKEFWLAPERREASLERLATHLSGLGVQIVLATAVLFAWPMAGRLLGADAALWGWAAVSLLVLSFVLWVLRQYQLFPAPDTATREAQGQRMPPRRPRRPGEPKT